MEKTMTAVVKDLNSNVQFMIGKEFIVVSQGYATIGVLKDSSCITLSSNNYEIVVTDFIPAIGNELVGCETVFKVDMAERTITNPDGMTLLIPNTGDMTLHDLVHLLDLFNK